MKRSDELQHVADSDMIINGMNQHLKREVNEAWVRRRRKEEQEGVRREKQGGGGMSEDVGGCVSQPSIHSDMIVLPITHVFSS